MKKYSFFRIIISIALNILCIGAITMALLEKETEKVKNVFSPKTYTDVDINEPNGNTYIINSDGKLSANKSASFNNPDKGTKDEYIRAKIVGIIRNEDGSNEGICPDLDIQYNEDSLWEKKGDFYYYKKIVSPGESTSNLFNDIKVNQNTLEKLQNGQYIEVSVLADSIECSKAYEAWGIKF